MPFQPLNFALPRIPSRARFTALALGLSLSLWTGCGEKEKSDPGFSYTGPSPLVVKVGETRTVSFKKVYAEENGRLKTVESYDNVVLTASDTTVFRVLPGLKVEGRQAGSATLTAADQGAGRKTLSLSVRVDAP